MLLAMVGIAARLVPLHHKMEHWMTVKMLEKNKRIGLAAAKKVMEKLERENAGSYQSKSCNKYAMSFIARLNYFIELE